MRAGRRRAGASGGPGCAATGRSERWSLGLNGCGANAGSAGSPARAACSSAVRVPSSHARSSSAATMLCASSGGDASAAASRPATEASSSGRRVRARERHAPRRWSRPSSVRVQPSPSFGTNFWSIATAPDSLSPCRSDTNPATGATFGNPRSVRKRAISRSGLMPLSILRNSLSISRSDRIAELLLCSPREWLTTSGSDPGPRRARNWRVGVPASSAARPRNLRRVATRSTSAVLSAGSRNAVVEDTGPAAGQVEAGNHAARRIRQQSLRRIALRRAEGNAVFLGVAVAVRHHQECQGDGPGLDGDHDDVRDGPGDDRARLAPEPAAAPGPLGEDACHRRRARARRGRAGAAAVTEERLPSPWRLEHRRQARRAICGSARGARRLQREPDEPVRAERQGVRSARRPPETRRCRTSRRGTMPGECRQVQLHVLAEARQVGDDEDRLVAEDPRRNASTLRLSGWRNSSVPRPNAGCRLRSAISRFIHHSSECGLACCASTLTAS